jgi:predicted metalloprotease with PDZ domain
MKNGVDNGVSFNTTRALPTATPEEEFGDSESLWSVHEFACRAGRVGLSIRSYGGHLAEVSRVAANSAAAEAGVPEGAAILAINGISMVDMAHDSIIDAFRTSMGARMRMIVSTHPRLVRRTIHVREAAGELKIEGRSPDTHNPIVVAVAWDSPLARKVFMGDEIAFLNDTEGKDASKKTIRKRVASTEGALVVFQPSRQTCVEVTVGCLAHTASESVPAKGRSAWGSGVLKLPTRTVRVYRNPSGLGMCVKSGPEINGITVSSMDPGRAAAMSGALQVGDVIVAVNGKDVTDLAHREVVALLAAPATDLVLTIRE